MEKLHQILITRRADVLNVWTSCIRLALGDSAAAGMSVVELVDHLPQFLDELTELLSYADTAAVPSADRTSTAGKHGLQRFRLGFDLDEVVREYGILHRCILAVADHEKVPVSMEEHRLLIDSIYGGIADAVTQYARQRDAELRRQSNEHFAFVAHELRNPLSSAQLALSSLSRRGLLGPGPLVDLLNRGLNRMKDLVESTLSLALAGDGVELARQRHRLSVLVGDAVKESDVAAKDKEISIEMDGDDCDLEADERLLRSALTNLIGNAVKFSQEGHRVRVNWRRVGDHVVVEISDGCGGLPVGASERMFDPFVQVGTDRSGYGLGLAIAKQAVQAHGGSIYVRNHPGEGCTFRIELPKALPANPE